MQGEYTIDSLEALMGEFDIFFLSRFYHNHTSVQEFIAYADEHGAQVVFDTDDDLTGEFRTEYIGDPAAFLHVIKNMRHVTVSTPYLAKRLEKHVGFRPTVLENHVDVSGFAEASMQAPCLDNGRVKIGFIGTATHYEDWKFPMDALARLAVEYEDQVRIVTAGYKPDYFDDLPNTVHLPGTDIFHYPSLVRQFDIICCSLDDQDKFNWSKSPIKALEAMAAARRVNGGIGGAVPVCTDMPVYRAAVIDGANGILTNNDNWYAPLRALVENASLRNRLAIRGHQWVKKNRDMQRGCIRWQQYFREVAHG